MFDDYRPKPDEYKANVEPQGCNKVLAGVFVVGFIVAVWVSVLIMNYTRGM